MVQWLARQGALCVTRALPTGGVGNGKDDHVMPMSCCALEDGATWRIIPVTKWLVTMVNFRPLSRVVPLPNGLFMACKWG